MKILKISMLIVMVMLFTAAAWQVNNLPPKDYVMVVVAPHDTVWDICSRVHGQTKQKCDVRETVYFTEKINGLSHNQPIQVGQQLKVAVFANE